MSTTFRTSRYSALADDSTAFEASLYRVFRRKHASSSCRISREDSPGRLAHIRVRYHGSFSRFTFAYIRGFIWPVSSLVIAGPLGRRPAHSCLRSAHLVACDAS